MRLIQSLLVLIFSIFLLMTLWPLFIFLVIVGIIYWIIIQNRVKQAMGEIHQMNQDFQSKTNNPNVFDAEVLDEREENKS